MATFNMGKGLDDVVEPELMSEDWYLMEIYKEPALAKNKTLLNEGPDAEGAGFNIPVNLRCVEEGEHKGRIFTLFLSLPGVGDDDKRNPISGMTYTDQKTLRNAEFALAFGGTVEGDEFSLTMGLIGKVFIQQKMDMSGTKLINQINPFNTPIAMPIDDENVEDEIPF